MCVGLQQPVLLVSGSVRRWLRPVQACHAPVVFVELFVFAKVLDDREM